MRCLPATLFCAWRLAAQCSYTTLAGHAVTFAAEGNPVNQALFHNPGGIAAAADGSLYIADTGNNRIRRIDKTGVIRTFAGTGQPSFAGDNGLATAAALNGPAGLVLRSDGTLYFSDSGNNRVRIVRTDGTIATVAGNGAWKFAGDNGPATAASLNSPGALAFDAFGNLLIADTGNARVRRVDAEGIITTIAGAATPDDYVVHGPSPAAAIAALQYEFTGLSGLTTGPDGQIYITDAVAIRTLGADGILRPWLVFTPGALITSITGSIPFGDLRIENANLAFLSDGYQILGAYFVFLRVGSGQVTQLPDAYWNIAMATDPSTGGIVTLNDGLAYAISSIGPSVRPTIIARLDTAGSFSVIYSYTPSYDVPATPALNLTLTPTGALAIAADGTVYFGDATPGPKPPYGRILALNTDGSLRVVTATNQPPRSLVLDSKGTLYFAQTNMGEILKVPASGGMPLFAYSASFYGIPLALAIDAQDRIYFIGSTSPNPLIRIDSDGTLHSLLNSSFNFFPGVLQIAANQVTPLPLAVSPDGVLYAGIPALFANSPSTILIVSPAGPQGLLTMESTINPAALTAPSASGTYIAYGPEVWKILPDGTIVTVYGSDRKGFYGEHGYDSQPGRDSVTGIAVTSDGNLIVTDTGGGAIRRINTAACTLSPSPVIAGIADSALGNNTLRRSAGGLFSIYGKRLGPVSGVTAAFDSTGHLPMQLGGTSVSVNGIAAPLLYVSATQINAVVPFALEGQGTGAVNVRYNGGTSDDYSQVFGYYGPTVFTFASSAFAVMQNQDGTLNTRSNPAKPGSIVTVYATGTGATFAPGEDGKQAGLPLKRTALPVSILVNGEAAQVLYSGEAPYLVEGTTQINFQIPLDAPIGQANFLISMGGGLGGYDNGSYFFYTGN